MKYLSIVSWLWPIFYGQKGISMDGWMGCRAGDACFVPLSYDDKR